MRGPSFNKASKPGQTPSSYDTEKKSRGFTGLDPSRMGLDTPDWLQPSTAPTAPADSSSLPNVETPSSAIPQAGESGAGAGAAEPRTLVEGMKVVCICKGIKKRIFWKALDDGARTKEEVNRATGSGNGSCQGRRCGPRILELLRNRGRE